MSKSRAIQWPTVVISSLPKSHSIHGTSPANLPFSTPRQHLRMKTHRLSSEISTSKLSYDQSFEATPFAKINAVPNKRVTPLRARSLSQCICTTSYFFESLNVLAPKCKILNSTTNRFGYRQYRQSHTSSASNAQNLQASAATRPSTDNSSPQRSRRTRGSRLADFFSNSTPSNTHNTPNIVVNSVKSSKKKNTSIRQPRHSSAAIHIKKAVVALDNLRLLIYPDRFYTHSSHLDVTTYHRALMEKHRIPSSIVPPLPALQQLYNILFTSRHINLLTPADWDAYIFWLSHHKDYHMLSLVHHTILGNPKLARKCSAQSYILLTEARLHTLVNGKQSILDHSESNMRSEDTKQTNGLDLPIIQSPSELVENTIEYMKAHKVLRNADLYRLWLATAFQERDWHAGIKAWKQMESEKKSLPLPSIATIAYAIQSYIHTDEITKTVKLLGSVIDRYISIQQQQSGIDLLDVTPLVVTSGSTGGNTTDMEAADGRIEFLRRRKQAIQSLATSQGKSIAARTPSSIEGWKAVINPILIEVICLGRDEHGFPLAMELALDLFEKGHALDEIQFQYLIRSIAANKNSQKAMGFMRRLVEMNKWTQLGSPKTHNIEIERVLQSLNDQNSAKSPIESRRIMTELGLQEILRQASNDHDFDRVQDMIQELTDQELPLAADVSEKVIIDLTMNHRFGAALEVLDKSLRDNHVPSISALNRLLRGLVKSDMLDESVELFRNLAENHGVKPDVHMYRNVLKLTAAYGQPPMTRRILSILEGLGVKRDGEMYLQLMLTYVRSENLSEAIKVFEEMDRSGIANEIKHINALLEGAVRHSIPATVVGILEIMSSQKIRPNAQTWNILLGGALRARDRLFARELYQELCHSVLGDTEDRSDGSLHASRHPETFQLLMNSFADRYGVESTLKLLKEALDAGYPSRVASSMYRELLGKSCKQRKGAVGYEFYRLLRQSENVRNRTFRRAMVRDRHDHAVTSLIRKAAVTLASPTAIIPSSPSNVPTLTDLYQQLMTQLHVEDQIAYGRDMSTDLILSGFHLTQHLAADAIRFYAKSGELSAAFGLFMKMGRAYGIESSYDMVQVLYEAAQTYGLIESLPSTELSSKMSGVKQSANWDENLTQLWIKALRTAMEKHSLPRPASIL